MVIVYLALSAILVLTLFVLLYGIFFPWWRTVLGRTMVLSKSSMVVLLSLGVIHLLNYDVGWVVTTGLLVLSLSGLIAANVVMVYELYRSWKGTENSGV